MSNTVSERPLAKGVFINEEIAAAKANETSTKVPIQSKDKGKSKLNVAERMIMFENESSDD